MNQQNFHWQHDHYSEGQEEEEDEEEDTRAIIPKGRKDNELEEKDTA